MSFENEICWCGSGKSYASCCRKIDLEIISSAHGFDSTFLKRHQPPFDDPKKFTLGKTFTYEACILTFAAKKFESSVDLPYYTICGLGFTADSVSYPKPVRLSSNGPIFRMGFCDNRLRPQCELLYPDGGRQEIAADFVLPSDRVYQRSIAAKVDCDSGDFTLYVDDKVVNNVRLKGIPSVCGERGLCAGYGRPFPAVFSRLSRAALSPTEFSRNRHDALGSISWDLMYPLRGEAVHVYISHDGNVALASTYDFDVRYMQTNAEDIAKDVLRLENVPEPEWGIDAVRESARILAGLREELRQIVDTYQTTEDDLRDFFKSHPAASRFIEPAQSAGWREQPLQDHGVIDFVFAKPDGRFTVVEIESHRAAIFTKKYEFRAGIHHAINQVEKWILGVEVLPAIVERRFGSGDRSKYSGCVVVGRRSDVNRDIKCQQSWDRQTLKGVVLKTWDDVLDQANHFIRFLENPAGTQWE